MHVGRSAAQTQTLSLSITLERPVYEGSPEQLWGVQLEKK